MIPHLCLISLFVWGVVEMEGWVGEIEGRRPSGYISAESDGGGKNTPEKKLPITSSPKIDSYRSEVKHMTSGVRPEPRSDVIRLK